MRVAIVRLPTNCVTKRCARAVGKYYGSGFTSSQTIWRHALTVLNVSSDAADKAATEGSRASWKWVGLVGVLALVVIFLNTGLFLLVQRHEREIADREIETQRRQVLVEAKEAQRS